MTIESNCLKGTIGDFSLADVIQLISMGGKSGHLALQNGSSHGGSLYFEFGYIVHAHFDSLEGEAAARSLILLECGTFQFSPCPAPGDRTVMLTGNELLMRAAQYLDEDAFLEKGAQLVLDIEEGVDTTLACTRERIKTLLQDRLGRRSRKLAAVVDAGGDTPDGLVSACERIERYIALFIDRAAAEEAGKEMREVLGLI